MSGIIDSEYRQSIPDRGSCLRKSSGWTKVQCLNNIKNKEWYGYFMENISTIIM